MSGGKLLLKRHFWRGTEEDLGIAGVRFPEAVEYLLDQQPLWIIRNRDEYWEKRFNLLTMLDNPNASEVYSNYLSGMKLPKRFLIITEKQNIIKYGKDRIKKEYGYE